MNFDKCYIHNGIKYKIEEYCGENVHISCKKMIYLGIPKSIVSVLMYISSENPLEINFRIDVAEREIDDHTCLVYTYVYSFEFDPYDTEYNINETIKKIAEKRIDILLGFLK